jgi:hypothetical protein
MSLDEPVFDHSTFSQNSERLLTHEAAQKFFDAGVQYARREGLLSNEHFTVDGTLIEAWASLKSVKPKEAPAPTAPPDDPGNPTVDFHGDRRTNATHQRVSIGDPADRGPRPLADGELLSLGKHAVRWLDTPYLPHAWECGFLFEERTSTLLCGDLFTQGGVDLSPITESDILGPSEAFRQKMDYFSHTKNARVMLQRLASTNPTTLACMHGSAWHGDGAALLRALADRLSA